MKDIHLLPLTRDPGYLDDCLREAKRMEAKGFHFSHHLCHHASDLLNDPDRAAGIRQVIGALNEQGRESWVWTHEIHDPPPDCLDEQGRLRFDDADWPGFLKRKYDRFLGEVVPGITGLVVTFAETAFEVYKDHRVVSNLSPELRLARLMEVLVEICDAHGVRVAVRDFVYRPHEVESMRRAIQGLPPEVIVMSKAVPHDWQPFYPPNPMLGRAGEREQWVEFDLGYEYEGQHMLPYANLEQHHAWWLAAREQGIRHACLRIDRYDGDAGQSALATPWGKLMLRAFTLWNVYPSVPPSVVRTEWEQSQFPGASDILRQATESSQMMFFPASNWLLNHCLLPTYDYAKNHLVDGNAARLADWTRDPAHLRVKERLQTLPEGFRAELAQEAADALALFREAGEQLELRLPDDHPDAFRWRDGFQQLGSHLELTAAYRDAFFRVREVEEHPDREGLIPGALQAIEAFRTLGAREAPRWADRVFTQKNGPASYRAESAADLFDPIADSLLNAMPIPAL
jgi:hypothetical protein